MGGRHVSTLDANPITDAQKGHSHMYLTKALADEIDNPDLSLNDRAHLRCRLAKQLEQAGDFVGAQEAMTELWQGVGARPMVEGLDDETSAQVLLRVGTLTGWIGSNSQIEGSQEIAKDLISESLRTFEWLGLKSKIGESRSELAMCYWREGAFDEARVTLEEALGEIAESDVEARAVTILRRAIVERASMRLRDALSIFNEAIPLFARIDDHLLTGHFHHGFANVLSQLGTDERRQDYTDRALIEYAAASFHFEEAGHVRVQACVENNLGFLFSTLKRYEEAHEHLDRAQMLMTRLKDNVHLAQVDETRARVLLAQGRIVEAEKTSRSAVSRLEKGDELGLLTQALTTHGIALARLSHSAPAQVALERAISVAEQVGNFENAGLAALSLLEQLGTRLSNEEAWATIDHVGTLLEKTQDAVTLRRLVEAFRSLFPTHAVPAPPKWDNFSFKDAVHRYEAHLLKSALNETNGKVTRAARLLGFRHHQSLITLIASRHKELLGARAPVRPRRKNLLTHPKRKRKQPN